MFHHEYSKTHRNVHSSPFFIIYIPIDRVLHTLSEYYMFYTIYCYLEVCVLDQTHDVFDRELKNCVCRVFRKNVYNFSNWPWNCLCLFDPVYMLIGSSEWHNTYNILIENIKLYRSVCIWWKTNHHGRLYTVLKLHGEKRQNYNFFTHNTYK